MSGDVQPRKRKDKKKRKDESADPPLLTSQNVSEDVNIHVHKEGGTGGNVCAKIVFFILFSALIVLIGLIIKENQGLTDLDEVESDSRFSQIFEGWVDSNPAHDDDHNDKEEAYDVSEDHHEDEDDLASEAEESEEDHDENSEENDISEEGNDIEQDDEPDEDETVEDENDELDDEDEDQGNEEEESEENNSETKSEEQEENNSEPEVSNEEDEGKDVEESEEAVEQSKEKSKEKQKSKEQKLSRRSREIDEDSEITKTINPAFVNDYDEDGNLIDQTEIEALVPEVDENSKKEEDKSKETKEKESGDVNIRPDGELDSGSEEEFANITNKEDYKIKRELDEGQRTLQSNAAFANKVFDALLQIYPFSPRCLYGKAAALDALAEKQQSNNLLQKSIGLYIDVLQTSDVPDTLFLMAAERCINRLRFIGHYTRAIQVHKMIMERFPDYPKYKNDLAVTYLTINMVDEARAILKEVLSKWPNDGYALVHYGFVLKTADNNFKDAVKYLDDGLKTGAPGVVDGRFYFHLGDAYARLGDTQSAMKVYESGVKEKVFMSKYQRSLYNVPRLTSKPWWEKSDLPYQDLIRLLEKNWQIIRDEGLAVLNKKGYFQDESEKLKDTGDWKQFELFVRGQRNVKNCEKSPVTCGIINSVPDASKCKRGQTKFSVMHPGTHVWPHCGPTNCRLRMHLGLKVPPKTFLRVAEEIRSWKEGEVIIFDDSFEHEVWHNGTELRMVLIVDIWHPELSSAEKKNLTPI